MVSRLDMTGPPRVITSDRESAAPAGGAAPDFDKTYRVAAEKLRDVTAKIVSSALLIPMLNRMQEDPFRSDLLGGGMAEDSFRSMLNTRLADAMTQKSDFALTDHMSQPMLRWLQSQPDATVRRVAAMRIDTLG